jgi:hypothetical protein
MTLLKNNTCLSTAMYFTGRQFIVKISKQKFGNSYFLKSMCGLRTAHRYVPIVREKFIKLNRGKGKVQSHLRDPCEMHITLLVSVLSLSLSLSYIYLDIRMDDCTSFHMQARDGKLYLVIRNNTAASESTAVTTQVTTETMVTFYT